MSGFWKGFGPLLIALILCALTTAPVMAQDNQTNSAPMVSQVVLAPIMPSDLPDLMVDKLTAHYTAAKLRKMQSAYPHDIETVIRAGINYYVASGNMSQMDETEIQSVISDTNAALANYLRTPQSKILLLGAAASNPRLVINNKPWYLVSEEWWFTHNFEPFAISRKNKETVAIQRGLPYRVAQFGYSTALKQAEDKEGFPLN